MLYLSNFESKKGYIVLAKIGKFFTKMVWFITILFIILTGIKVFIYRQNHQVSQQPQTQGLDVKSGKEFDKQFKELEQFMDDREKAKKIQKPAEARKPEANNSIKDKNMLLKKFDENYNFDGA
jgi:hypothetical protein